MSPDDEIQKAADQSQPTDGIIKAPEDGIQGPIDPAQVIESPTETEGSPIKVFASVEVVLNAQNKSQLTKAELDGVLFYVRENAGPTGPEGKGEHWLELCAPEPYWLRISGIVTCEDSLERKVRKNPEFTAEWAEKVLADGAKAQS